MKSELAVASRLLKHIDWKGKVLTGDALYCQRCLCHALRQAGGDYLFLVKANQPQLLEEIRLLFAPPEPIKRAGEGILRLPEQSAQTAERGHGRMDMRKIRLSSELKGYSDWPGLEQVFEIRRGYRSKGVWKESVHYGVTSLPATIATPPRVLKVKRGHWGIGAIRFAETSEKLGDGEQGGERSLTTDRVTWGAIPHPLGERGNAAPSR